ncbi:hypothetical protein SAMN05444003_1487 [Cognatiyoonia sediminum]|uniref:YgjP-like metallopeptidase domain-containing protein n=1 Tax=Cognatiyoonia sediminum TaxID=1508389 RepID=A0A1M5NLV0_9RHOB|nr:SprT family zinc-dependent metalloprotease [Cognatiyoonia sediminum]SHG90447.1 hypothetical protein SAMN05444003_1487 [Cognatiyoonia sediminum]
MGRQFSIGNPPIAVNVKTSARARRLSLRVSRLDGAVSLTVPKYSSDREAMAFLQEREEWLRKHLGDVMPKASVQIGGSVMFGGVETPIVAAEVRRARFEDGVFYVPDDASQSGVRLKALLKLKARDALAVASDHYAAELGRRYTRISLRDTRSRWGSCSSQGVLMYSWRLIMAPVDVLNYVAAHEASHLVEMNHSAAFWETVAGLMPDYEVHRRWLRENGDSLHRYDFGN